jgi:hypothetical protein
VTVPQDLFALTIFLDELDFFRFPVMDPDLPVGEVGITFGLVVPAGAPNPLQANAFAGFMGSLESTQLLTQQTSAQLTWVPVHTDYDRSLYNDRIRKAEELVQQADAFRPADGSFAAKLYGQRTGPGTQPGAVRSGQSGRSGRLAASAGKCPPERDSEWGVSRAVKEIVVGPP